ncbi:cupin domain-containing protein [Ectothiorhodospiraceae bacterium 2226]|nr:cupin domain-containing protein [Ectothiorhodospiraceae bacterium 2226]
MQTLLGGLDPADFLDRHWQKRPLLVRAAFPHWADPLVPEELAGLACEANVNSRLVLERGGEQPWQVEYGPHAEQRFLDLPETHWTLLVQDVDRHVPAAATLLEPFGFLPDWRVDDVMVSYAAPQGSVGPHVDAYDVFLVQGRGRRRWEISTQPVAPDNVMPGLDLRILRDFHAEQVFELGPGDMLYLPPGVAHHGIALEPCMTYSVGFRAPTHTELLEGVLEHALDELGDAEARYADPDLCLPAHRSEITAEALARIRDRIQHLCLDPARSARWFGRYVTAPQGTSLVEAPEEPLADVAALAVRAEQAGGLWRDPACRFAFVREGEALWVFAHGEAQRVPAAAAEGAAWLCDQRHYPAATLAAHWAGPLGALLLNWYNHGYVRDDTF